MHDRIALTLRISSALLVLSGYLAMASVAVVGMGILLIPLVLLILAPLGEYLDRTSKLYRIAGQAAQITFICFLPYLLATLGMLYAVVTVLIFVQAYTLLHIKSEKNYYHLYLMAFFLLLAACADSPEPVIGLVLLLFLQSAIWAFLCLRLHVESLAHSGDKHPEIMPLEQHRASLVPEQPNLFDRGLVFAVSTVSIAAIMLTILGFRFTPRVEAGLLGRSDGVVSRSGLSESVDIRGNEFIQEDESPVMHVRFPDLEGGWFGDGEGMYWRVTTLNYYENSQWARRQLLDPFEPGVTPIYHFEQADKVPERGALLLSRQRRQDRPLVRQEIYLDRAPDTGLPALDLVQAIEINVVSKDMTISWDKNQDFTVLYSSQGPRRLTYDAWSEIDTLDEALLRRTPNEYDLSSRRRRDLELLTSHDLLPQTVALAANLTANQNNPYDKILALQRWLSSELFLYSLEVPPLPAQNPIDAFINLGRIGHCQLYATALALMTRSLGIPARVVSGYRGGEWDEGDQAYTVRASMAHLWVEAYFPEAGWVVFDPSPRGEDVELGTFAQFIRTMSAFALRSKIFWYREVVGFEDGIQLSRLRDLTVAFFKSPFQIEFTEGLAAAPDTRRRGIILFLVSVLAGGLLIGILWRNSQQTVRLRRRQCTPGQLRAIQLYQRLRRRLERLGLACQGKTAEEIQSEVASRDLPGADTAMDLLRVYNAARFGARDLSEVEYRKCLAALKTLAQR